MSRAPSERVKHSSVLILVQLLSLAWVNVIPQSAAAQQPYFTGLGDLPGGEFFSDTIDVSRDGKVVIGTSRVESSQTTTEAFRWTRSEGMISLGTVGGASSEALRISADGSSIVGIQVGDSNGP